MLASGDEERTRESVTERTLDMPRLLPGLAGLARPPLELAARTPLALTERTAGDLPRCASVAETSARRAAGETPEELAAAAGALEMA
jgi:hypothetical protein